MIIDTDVLIWYLRDNANAVRTVMSSMPFSISIITYMELMQGMRNKKEMNQMKNAFREMDVSIIPISENISCRAADFVEKYTLSNSMEMAVP